MGPGVIEKKPSGESDDLTGDGLLLLPDRVTEMKGRGQLSRCAHLTHQYLLRTSLLPAFCSSTVEAGPTDLLTPIDQIVVPRFLLATYKTDSIETVVRGRFPM